MSAQSRIRQVTSHITESNKFFNLTVDNGFLSLEQRKQYEMDGFFVVKGLLSNDDCDSYLKRFEEICNMSSDDLQRLQFLVMRDVSIAKTDRKTGALNITKLQDWQDDPALFEFCKHPQIVEYMKCFCGPNVKTMHTMLINKPPDTGTGTSRHPMHQDLWYFPMRPSDRIACAWAALERVNRANGCLTVIPGSHRQFPLLNHEYPEWEGGVNRLYHGVRIDDKIMDRRIFVEMEKGDVVFFHPLLVHGSGTNRTTGCRKAISCHYASSDCWCIDIKNTVQESVAAEAAATYAKKMRKKFLNQDMPDISVDVATQAYNQMWVAKSRLVAGRQGTF